MTDHSSSIALTADIVSAYVINNTVRANELPALIAAVHASLTSIAAPKVVEEPVAAPVPAVSIKKSITGDYLVCLDDGKNFRSLKRHLASLGMTPDEYRTKWGLPRDYPMVAPGYAAKRSELAKAAGLGSNRRAAVPEPVAAPEPPPPPEQPAQTPAKRRGRPAKKAA